MLKKGILGTIVGLVVLVSIYVLAVKNSKKETSPTSQASQDVQKVAEAQEKERSVVSLDGTKKLTLKEEILGPNHTYGFYIDENTVPLFSKTVSQEAAMDIPDNSWSPGEKYIFVEESNGTAIPTYFVLKTDGTAFADGQQVKNVNELFTARGIGYVLTEATGWADSAMLILKTVKDTGEKGPSYWFVVENSGFMQLYR